MSATSEVQICSNALLLLGQNPISSFDDAGDSALLASNLWPTVRDAVLRSHPWNCAMKRVILSPDVAKPAFDWPYAFSLPGDYLRVWTVGRRDDNPPEYEVEGGKILLNDAICYLRYIFQQTDITKYDAMLILALHSGMAAIFAYPITKSQTEQDAMLKLHISHLKLARTLDGQEGTGENSGVAELILARGF